MVSWPALGAIGAGLANLYLLRYLWGRRDAPGGWWFLALIGVQVYWGVVYGVALSVFDPGVRLGLEIATWLGPIWIGVFYLAFALAYTGRGHLVSGAWFKLVVGYALLSTGLVATNPIHGLVWSDFAVDPVFGAATVSYVHHPWVFVQYFATFAMASTAVLVLLDTVASYGPRYRAQSVAVALTPVPPALAFTLWVFQIGPAWQLNLTPIMFLPHVALDLYALFRGDMFAFNPATRRAGERAAIDDLGNPVVVVDLAARVVTANDAAVELFDTDREGAFARPLPELLDDPPADLLRAESQVTVRPDGRRRTFRVTPSPLTDGTGARVGHTIVFYDVTDTLRREQRLDVLNRVLRHNLRNDLGIVMNYTAAADDAAGSEEVSALLDTVQEKAGRLVELGEKAREFERVLALDGDPRSVEVEALLSEVVEAVAEAYPEASVSLSCPEDLTVSTDPEALRLACESLVENAAEHGGTAPSVEVAAVRTPSGVEIHVEDDGPGIPDIELDTLASGTETALQHGQGLGLWIVDWLSDRIGATVDYETDDGGTRVTLALPG